MITLKFNISPLSLQCFQRAEAKSSAALFFDNECIILYSKRVSKWIINIRVSIDKMNEIGNKIRLSVSWDNDENFVFLTIRGLKKGEPFAAAEFLERLNAPYLGMKELNLDARAKEEPKILSGVKGDCLTGELLGNLVDRRPSQGRGALMPGTVDLACYFQAGRKVTLPYLLMKPCIRRHWRRCFRETGHRNSVRFSANGGNKSRAFLQI